MIITRWIPLRMKNISNKSCRENRTHILCSITFFGKSYHLRDSVEKCYSHKLRISNTYWFSEATIVKKCASILSYKYLASLVKECDGSLPFAQEPDPGPQSSHYYHTHKLLNIQASHYYHTHTLLNIQPSHYYHTHKLLNIHQRSSLPFKVYLPCIKSFYQILHLREICT